jgi:hypothetical protein
MMSYPDPLLVARMFALRPSSKGNPRAVFRSNGLVPKPLWGRPVLYWRDKHTPDLSKPDEFIPNPTLVYGNYIVPMVYYLQTLQDTAHHPDTTNPQSIIYFPPINNAVQILQTSGGKEFRQGLASVRDAVIHDAFEKQIGVGTSVKGILKEIALHMGVGQGVVRKALASKGYQFDETVKNPNRIPRSIFDTSAEWQFKYKILRKAVQTARNTTTASEGSFHINALYVNGERGGYITHCPVAGLEINWEVYESFSAPRVGRYDLTKGYTNDNVVLMSKFAKRMIERTGDPNTLLPFLKSDPEILSSAQSWIEKYPTAADGVDELRLALTRTNNTTP